MNCANVLLRFSLNNKMLLIEIQSQSLIALSFSLDTLRKCCLKLSHRSFVIRSFRSALYRSCLMYSIRGSNLGMTNAVHSRKLLNSCHL